MILLYKIPRILGGKCNLFAHFYKLTRNLTCHHCGKYACVVGEGRRQGQRNITVELANIEKREGKKFNRA